MVVNTKLGTIAPLTDHRPPETRWTKRSSGGTTLGPTLRKAELVATFWTARLIELDGAKVGIAAEYPDR